VSVCEPTESFFAGIVTDFVRASNVALARTVDPSLTVTPPYGVAASVLSVIVDV
jgi:hypothetical protein